MARGKRKEVEIKLSSQELEERVAEFLNRGKTIKRIEPDNYNQFMERQSKGTVWNADQFLMGE